MFPQMRAQDNQVWRNKIIEESTTISINMLKWNQFTLGDIHENELRKLMVQST